MQLKTEAFAFISINHCLFSRLNPLAFLRPTERSSQSSSAKADRISNYRWPCRLHPLWWARGIKDSTQGSQQPPTAQRLISMHTHMHAGTRARWFQVPQQLGAGVGTLRTVKHRDQLFSQVSF